MKTVHLLAIAGAVGSLVVLAPQTGAFTATTADRAVSVAVADDENAYLGIQRSPVSVDSTQSTIERHWSRWLLGTDLGPS